MPGTVSCIIPVFNGEAWIDESLDSVLDQTRPPDEVVVIDDGSTDATADRVAAYGAHVACVRQENAGPSAARNRGVGVATGTLIAFQDADDIWLPDKLERQLRRFEERPDVEVSLTHLRSFWIEELRAEEAALQGHALTRPSMPGWVPQTMLVRREVLDRVGPFAEHLRIGEDTDWFLRARELRVTIDVLPEVLVLRRFHQNNLTRGRQLAGDLLDVVARSVARRRENAPGTEPSNGSAV